MDILKFIEILKNDFPETDRISKGARDNSYKAFEAYKKSGGELGTVEDIFRNLDDVYKVLVAGDYAPATIRNYIGYIKECCDIIDIFTKRVSTKELIEIKKVVGDIYKTSTKLVNDKKKKVTNDCDTKSVVSNNDNCLEKNDESDFNDMDSIIDEKNKIIVEKNKIIDEKDKHIRLLNSQNVEMKENVSILNAKIENLNIKNENLLLKLIATLENKVEQESSFIKEFMRDFIKQQK
jgi:hypothetical protein